MFYTKRYCNLTFQTLSVHQNKSRQTMTNTVIVYTDTLSIVYRTGTSIIPHYVFTCKMSCFSSLFKTNLLLLFKKFIMVTSLVKKKPVRLFSILSYSLSVHMFSKWLTCVPRWTIDIKSFRERSWTKGEHLFRIAYRKINFS